MSKSPSLKSKGRPGIWLPSIFSAGLLVFSYPVLSQAYLAWAALSFFFWRLGEAKTRKDSVLTAFLTGLILYAVSISWMSYVAVGAWIALSILLALYTSLFGLLYYEILFIKHPLLRSLAAAAAWMTVEIIRTEFPVFGLGWNLLAYSQTPYLPVIQSASVFGAYGLGFVLAFCNSLLAEGFRIIQRRRETPPAEFRKQLLILFLALTAAVSGNWAYGFHSLRQAANSNERVRLSVIQGNIPQSVKWEMTAQEHIVDIHLKLTRLAALENPDLILWPEASFPGYFNRDPEAGIVTEWIKHLGKPVLLGAPFYEPGKGAYNSAFYIDAKGEVAGRYDKMYLVPFGEYVPLGPLLGWLQPFAQAMGVSDFLAGREFSAFRLRNPEAAFSVLICFEDVFPGLVRKFAKENHRFLAVITNDAWFGPTGAPFQHLQASIFRAVESGLPIVRSANTGVSAFISRKGEVLATVSDGKGNKIFVPGYKTLDLPLGRAGTLYYRGGWIVPYLTAVFLIVMIAIRAIMKKRFKAEAREKEKT